VTERWQEWCSKCGRTNDRPNYSYCSTCHAAYESVERKKVRQFANAFRWLVDRLLCPPWMTVESGRLIDELYEKAMRESLDHVREHVERERVRAYIERERKRADT
jgi:hypothetical protein